MSLTKPILALAVGGALGLLDGLNGFLEPSLAPLMASVITFSLAKGLVSGIAIGFFSTKVHSVLWGILAGLAIAAALSLLVILRGGMALFWDILLPGMLLGVIVGFATQIREAGKRRARDAISSIRSDHEGRNHNSLKGE